MLYGTCKSPQRMPDRSPGVLGMTTKVGTFVLMFCIVLLSLQVFEVKSYAEACGCRGCSTPVCRPVCKSADCARCCRCCVYFDSRAGRRRRRGGSGHGDGTFDKRSPLTFGSGPTHSSKVDELIVPTEHKVHHQHRFDENKQTMDIRMQPGFAVVSPSMRCRQMSYHGDRYHDDDSGSTGRLLSRSVFHQSQI